ncbi:MAG: hypothetical protein ACI8W8_003746 [Rhodothermales bacterium]|jgi:hypothetical protein
MKALALAVLLVVPVQAGESWFEKEGSQLVFFSVLEGLYRDGVSQETVKALLPEGRHEMTHSFVYVCPLCHPTFEAFRIYAMRKPFYGQKASSVDTFGEGLNAAQRVQLKSKNPNERRAALQSLIDRWVGQRLVMMRLSNDERLKIAAEIKKLKEEGERMLKGFHAGHNGDFYKDIYEGWESCPSCDCSAKGAFRSAVLPQQ